MGTKRFPELAFWIRWKRQAYINHLHHQKKKKKIIITSINNTGIEMWLPKSQVFKKYLVTHQ